MGFFRGDRGVNVGAFIIRIGYCPDSGLLCHASCPFSARGLAVPQGKLYNNIIYLKSLF